jgi:hypothetical protein
MTGFVGVVRVRGICKSASWGNDTVDTTEVVKFWTSTANKSFSQMAYLKSDERYHSSSSSSSTGPRWLVLPKVLQPAGLFYEPGFESSHLDRQEPPRLQRRERPYQGKRELWARNVRWILSSNSEFHARSLKGSFTCRKSATREEGMLRIFSTLKTRKLGYQKPAC